MRSQTPKLSIFLTAACAFGLLLVSPHLAQADAATKAVRCDVAPLEGTVDERNAYSELTSRSRDLPTRVVDLEYQIISELMKKTDIFHDLVKEVGPYAQWNAAGNILSVFEKRHGAVEDADPKVIAKAYGVSMSQAQLAIEAISDLKELEQSTPRQYLSIDRTVVTTNEQYIKYKYFNGYQTRAKKIVRAALFLGEKPQLADLHVRFRTAVDARLKELEDSVRPLDRNVERSFTRWARELAIDERSSRDSRYLIENASARIETATTLITALNLVEMGNGQTYESAYRFFKDSDDMTRATWEGDVLLELSRKQDQLRLVIDHLSLMEVEFANPPAQTREAVDEEDARLQANTRKQWAPLLAHVKNTAILKFSVLEVQKQALESGLTRTFLESHAKNKPLRLF